MNYRVVWEPEAQRQLDRLDPLAYGEVLVASDELADGPVRLSRPAQLLFQGRGQQYAFTIGERSALLTFQYGQGEQTLHVIDVSVV